jgi:hypothetical protein
MKARLVTSGICITEADFLGGKTKEVTRFDAERQKKGKAKK